jgi:hypothetical protein
MHLEPIHDAAIRQEIRDRLRILLGRVESGLPRRFRRLVSRLDLLPNALVDNLGPYIGPKRPPLRSDGKPMTPDDIRELRERIAEFDEIAWIDEVTREIVEKFMPDLVDRLPERTSETFHQALGRKRAAAKRKTTVNERRKRNKPRGRLKAVTWGRGDVRHALDSAAKADIAEGRNRAKGGSVGFFDPNRSPRQ